MSAPTATILWRCDCGHTSAQSWDPSESIYSPPLVTSEACPACGLSLLVESIMSSDGDHERFAFDDIEDGDGQYVACLGDARDRAFADLLNAQRAEKDEQLRALGHELALANARCKELDGLYAELRLALVVASGVAK